MRFYKEQSELFEGIQNGDADAFEYVFKTYYPRLRNYANRFVSDNDDLEDILQNCFIHLWERRDSITFISISALLFTMVRNGCLNYLKHQTMVNGYEAGSLSNIPGAEELYSTDMKGTTDSDTLYNELTRQIEQVMEELSPRCREIFTMSRGDYAMAMSHSRSSAEALPVLKWVRKTASALVMCFSTTLTEMPSWSAISRFLSDS